MTVVPVVTERAIRAGLLLFPLALVLVLLAQGGDGGTIGVGIVIVGAVLYAGVGWLVGDRRRIAAELAAVGSAPPEAELESLARTAVRGLRPLVIAVAACVLLAQVNALVGGLMISGGYGLLAALGALTLGRSEAAGEGRLVRGPDGGLERF